MCVRIRFGQKEGIHTVNEVSHNYHGRRRVSWRRITLEDPVYSTLHPDSKTTKVETDSGSLYKRKVKCRGKRADVKIDSRLSS